MAVRVMTAGVRLRSALLVAGLVLAALPALAYGAPANGAFDYTRVAGLSQPIKGVDVEKEVVLLPAFDGKKLYLEVTRPDVRQRVPVIFVASPYHETVNDREGTDQLVEPTVGGKRLGLTGFFPQRGYAVVFMDLRGTGKSQGCLDHLGPNDAKDLKTAIEWAASQPWSNGRVGMTGHSYVGSTPPVAAAQNPKGLVTIAPSAGVASIYDHQFQGGVPYYLQYVGPQVGYPLLTILRDLPAKVNTGTFLGTTGQNFGNEPGGTACGMASSALLAGSGQVTGQYEAWHAARDWSKQATAARIPVFLLHGLNDPQIRVPGTQWFLDRGGRPGDKAWIGQWGHGISRGLQRTYALLAWFDKHLKNKPVDTGPPVEVFLNDAATLPDAIADVGRRQVLLPGRFPAAKPTLRLFPAADGSMSGAPKAAGTQAFSGDARAHTGDLGGTLMWSTAPMTRDLVLAGLPELMLAASVTSPQVNLVANLLDRSPDGSLRRIGHFAINPLLRNGIRTVTPVVPGEVMKLKPPAFAMGHRLAKGHSLVLQVATSDPDKAPLFPVDPRVTVATGPDATELRLPVVKAPRILQAGSSG